MRPTVALFRDFAVVWLPPKAKPPSPSQPRACSAGLLLFGENVSQVECGTNITPIKDSGVVPLYPQVALWDTSAASLNPELEFH